MSSSGCSMVLSEPCLCVFCENSHLQLVGSWDESESCNMWAHGMNPSLILNLLPKTAVFEDEYFGRKCVTGSSFHYSCEEAQKAVFLHVAMSSS